MYIFICGEYSKVLFFLISQWNENSIEFEKVT